MECHKLAIKLVNAFSSTAWSYESPYFVNYRLFAIFIFAGSRWKNMQILFTSVDVAVDPSMRRSDITPWKWYTNNFCYTCAYIFAYSWMRGVLMVMGFVALSHIIEWYSVLLHRRHCRAFQRKNRQLMRHACEYIWVRFVRRSWFDFRGKWTNENRIRMNNVRRCQWLNVQTETMQIAWVMRCW